MTRAIHAIGILFLGFLLFSCAAWERIDGTTPEEKEKLKMSKDQLWTAYKRYEADNRLLQRQIAQLKSSAAQKDSEIKRLTGEINGLEQENRSLKEEKQKLEAALARKEAEKAEPAPAADEKGNIEKLKIKVLGGDGTLRSANRMTARLREMGYKIRLIHLAPTTNFSKDTIFYAEGFKEEGEHLASRIGGSAVVKPLTWPSEFDLIVVAGKNP